MYPTFAATHNHATPRHPHSASTPTSHPYSSIHLPFAISLTVCYNLSDKYPISLQVMLHGYFCSVCCSTAEKWKKHDDSDTEHLTMLFAEWNWKESGEDYKVREKLFFRSI